MIIKTCLTKRKMISHVTSLLRIDERGYSTLYCQQAWHQHLKAGKNNNRNKNKCKIWDNRCIIHMSTFTNLFYATYMQLTWMNYTTS